MELQLIGIAGLPKPALTNCTPVGIGVCGCVTGAIN